MSETEERKPAEELAPARERVDYWGRQLIHMCREHERVALLVNATPWYIAPVSRPLKELQAALDDLKAEERLP